MKQTDKSVLPLTKQVGKSLVRKCILGVLWGHQDYLKPEAKRQKNIEQKGLHANFIESYAFDTKQTSLFHTLKLTAGFTFVASGYDTDTRT